MMITRGFSGKPAGKSILPDYQNNELKRILSELMSDRIHTSGTRTK